MTIPEGRCETCGAVAEGERCATCQEDLERFTRLVDRIRAFTQLFELEGYSDKEIKGGLETVSEMY